MRGFWAVFCRVHAGMGFALLAAFRLLFGGFAYGEPSN